ncbi:MAG: Lipid II:glycine glycyltransferase [bacterium ADurb.Bin400]|nr:MAG: Lipid II:glycine glycyltransferase [bacterium ADurb.Bin400]
MASTIFQTEEWAQFKLKTGYSEYLWLGEILVLVKKLALGRTMLYSPMVGAEIATTIDKKLLSQVSDIGRERKSLFYRLEIDAPQDDFNTNHLHEQGFIKAFEELQPEHTLSLDTTLTETEILSQMKPKGRYNIKVAEKHGVYTTTASTPGKELDAFYDLYSTMAKRQNISYRAKSYFEALLEILGKRGYAKVYLAQVKESDLVVPLAAAIIITYGNKAIYLFGGSSNEFRNLMAPYLLHWQAIKETKAQGVTEYDFFGITNSSDPKHPWSGITRFKRQFGGKEIDLVGSYDKVFRPTEYKLFKIAEKVRR